MIMMMMMIDEVVVVTDRWSVVSARLSTLSVTSVRWSTRNIARPAPSALTAPSCCARPVSSYTATPKSPALTPSSTSRSRRRSNARNTRSLTQRADRLCSLVLLSLLLYKCKNCRLIAMCRRHLGFWNFKFLMVEMVKKVELCHRTKFRMGLTTVQRYCAACDWKSDKSHWW